VQQKKTAGVQFAGKKSPRGAPGGFFNGMLQIVGKKGQLKSKEGGSKGGHKGRPMPEKGEYRHLATLNTETTLGLWRIWSPNAGKMDRNFRPQKEK